VKTMFGHTPNSSMDTAFVQVNLTEDHSTGSYAYIDRVRRQLASDVPEIQTYFQAGGLVDSVINQGLPAPFDIQISSDDQPAAYAEAQDIAQQPRGLSSVSDVYIPQDLKYPGLQLNIDRERASLIGLSPKDVVDNVITALTSNGVIAPTATSSPAPCPTPVSRIPSARSRRCVPPTRPRTPDPSELKLPSAR
jgi:multidrug efflux pump subunit AcrB